MTRNASSLRPSPQPSGSSLRQRLLLALLTLLFAAAAAYGALVLLTRIDNRLFPGNGIHLPFSAPGISQDGNSARMNFLIMGLDRRPREGQAPARTDTMFVLTVDPNTKTGGILGIPRDLWVDIPDPKQGTFEDRINTAFVYGAINKDPGGGPQLAIDTVEKNLGINIDYYVVIDFQGFEKIIDSLGGIDIDVPDYVSDPCYSETELPGDCLPEYFEPGLQHMDGITALAYSRIRRNSSDLDRIQRQQRVVYAVMDKALSPGIDVLKNAVSLWNKYQDTIDTNVPDSRIPGLAKLAADIPQEKISGLSLGPCTTPWTTPAGAEVLLPSKEGCQRIVDALFSDQALIAERAVVEIQDGSGEGIGSAISDLLANLGFAKASLTNTEPADGSLYDHTEIIDFSGKTYTEQKLAEWLSVSPQRVRAATAADAALRTGAADIVVILGADTNVDALNAASSSDTSQ